jgi:hypothetical protein
MTPQDIIIGARPILNDTDPVTPRQTDVELLKYVNDGLREMVPLQPTLFSTIGDMVCDPDSCEQAITFVDAAALLEVLCIHEGEALTPFDMMAMGAFNPGWRTDPGGPARQWTRFANDPLRFYLYPKAPATLQVIDVRYARIPAAYALADVITEIPVTLQPALIDYVVYRAESKDDEHVLSQRASQFYQSFVVKVKG